MRQAFGVSDEDVRYVLQNMLGKRYGYNAADQIAIDHMLNTLDQDQVASAALTALDFNEQTSAAHNEIRDQLVYLGFSDEVVAEWVKMHYLHDFNADSDEEKADWRNRWVDSHPLSTEPANNMIAV